MPFSEDRRDKDNPRYTFTPKVSYTPEQVEAGKKLVEVLNDENLSETQKKDGVWKVLNSNSY